jgi:hypothetical protein
MAKYDYSFYNRNGKPCTYKEWTKEFTSTHVFYKEAYVNGLRVLTKWTGVDMPEYSWMQQHQFSIKSWKPSSKAFIFVTYVWNEDKQIIASKRYQKIEQAYKGHAQMIRGAEHMDFGVYYVPHTKLEDVLYG